MKEFTKEFIATVILIIVVTATSYAQTNVSGGIYANTTWTLANSPYIVVDTVVVFPNVTLTIEAGVIVKFQNSIRLEIRNATIISEGTSTDSITFTSNSASPFPGIWSEIFLNGIVNTSKFNYCNFIYAAKGLRNEDYGDSVVIKNSKFHHNHTGVHSKSYSQLCFLDSCSLKYNTYGVNCVQYDFSLRLNHCDVSNNQTGLSLWGNSTISNSRIDSNNIEGIYIYTQDSIINCEIKHNGIGLRNYGHYPGYPSIVVENFIENNNIGIKLGGWGDIITCNKICYNNLYDLYNNTPWSTNADVMGNYWCSTDSATISAHIFDGYDNINFALANFVPFDTVGCYLTGCNLSISANITNATCDTCHNGHATAMVGNGFAPFVYTWYTNPIQTTQTVSGLSPGNYTICVSDANGCTACNTVFIDSTNCTGFSIMANANNSTCSSCSDGYAWVTVIGDTLPYTYTWYTSPIQTTDTATGLMPGTYSVCVTNFYGCTYCDTVIVSAGNCSAHFNLYPDSIAHHYLAVNMASGVAPLSYSWNWGDGTPNDTIPFPNHTYATPGLFTICLTIIDSAGCTNTYCNSYYLLKTSNTLIYINVVQQAPTGISEEFNRPSILIFPNPVSDDKLNIKFQETPYAKVSFELFDVNGRKVYAQKLAAIQTQSVLLPHLENGIYHVVVLGNFTSHHQKIVFIEK